MLDVLLDLGKAVLVGLVIFLPAYLWLVVVNGWLVRLMGRWAGVKEWQNLTPQEARRVAAEAMAPPPVPSLSRRKGEASSSE